MAPMLENLTAELLDKLKQRSIATLSGIVGANSKTVYYNESPLLSRFRNQLGAIAHDAELDDQELLKIFTSTLPLSEYSDYQPFITRLFESPCRISRITDLLAPGVPMFIAHSSGTTGAAAKTFIKHKFPLVAGQTTSVDTACMIFSARYIQVVDVFDDNGDKVIKKLPVCLSSARAIRGFSGFDVEADESLMSKQIPPSNTSPFAVTLIQDYCTFLLMHGFYALMDPALAVISIPFSTAFYDFIRLLKDHWEVLVQSIKEGTLPNLDGLDESRPHLQGLRSPDPTRAAELRSVDAGTEGWLQKVWPSLKLVNTAVGGAYGLIIPKLRYHLGPQVAFYGVSYGSTEVLVAWACSRERLELLKVWDKEYFEYLDIERPDSVEELRQAWELVPGRMYELVVTTRDGLWRYRLADVIEVMGFDAEDGQPIIQFAERRNISLLISDLIITEQNLTNAIHASKDAIGDVTEFTAFVDDRSVPSSCGYFVELDDPGPHPKAAEAIALVHARLSQENEPYKKSAANRNIGNPSIHVLAPGTFRDYREWKTEAAGGGSGQIKVPSVVQSEEATEWFRQRVAYEI